MNVKLLSIDKLSSKSVFWTRNPYLTKIRLANYDQKVEVFAFEYEVDGRVLQGLKIQPLNNTKKIPVIIFGRGGNNTNPEEDDMGTSLPQMNACACFEFAIKGYCIYTTQLSGYGLNSGKDEFGGEDLNDIIALKELIDNDPICDNTRIGMLGYSRGGMMSYLVLTKVNWLKAVAVVGAPTNLLRNSQEREGMNKVMEIAFGATEEGKKQRSVLFNVSAIPRDSNILIQHGEKDWRVNQLDSIELAEKLKEANINYKLIVYPEDDHTITINRKDRDSEILKWFNSYL